MRAVKLLDDVENGKERNSNQAGVLREMIEGKQASEFHTPGEIWNAIT